MTADSLDGRTWMGRLRRAAEYGEEVDLAPGLLEDEADPPYAEEGAPTRRVPAEVIRAVLLEPSLVVDPRGLQIRGALVSGTLDLDHSKLPCRLVFSHCRFENALSLEQAHLPELILDDVVVPSLSLSSARVAGNCILGGLRARGGVDADNVRIGGQLNLGGAKLSNPDGDALSLNHAQISGGAFLRGLKVTGAVWAFGARITGGLVLTRAKISNPGGEALSLDGAEVTGKAILKGLEATGAVRAIDARITGPLDLTGAQLANQGGNALSLDRAEITGAFLEGLEATGAVRAVAARITGHLDLTRAKLTNPSGDALVLDGAEITGGAVLKGLEATGAVRAVAARITGQLNFTGAKLTNPSGEALSLDRAEITGGAFLGALEAVGEVGAGGARITGQLFLRGAKLTNPSGDALSLDGAEITGGAFLEGLEAAGEVGAGGARITGQLFLSGAKLTNPSGDALVLDGAEITSDAVLTNLEATGEVRADTAHISYLDLTGARLMNPAGDALRLDGAQITSDAVLTKLEAAGEVRASGARITGQLDLRGANLTNPERNALDLSNATLGTVNLDDAFTAEGRMDFSFTSIRVLSVGPKKPAKGLPLLAGAHGWTVGTIHGFLRTDRKSACVWLDTVDASQGTLGSKEFAAQPWKELARIYDQIGQPEDGRRLRFWAAQRTTRVAPWTSKVVRWPYSALVGYGYYPAITLFWLTALWMGVFVLCSSNAQAFTPTDLRASTITIVNGSKSEEVRVTGATRNPPNYPSFNSGLFAVDTAIPAAATGQAGAWRVTDNAWLSAVFATVKGFAWLLTALLLAGITGILRKD